ncbi:MAG: hypothetical protein WDM86_01545 [Rhizomicrobium sp.]
MKTTLALSAAAFLALASGAQAGDLSGYFGNTVSCKYANGDVTKILVAQDGTFSVIPTGHPQSKGTWKDDGSTICYTQTDPTPSADMKPVCNSSQARAVGDSWTVTDPFGGTCTATLVAGKP